MSADVMRVRLHLRGVRVTEVVVDAPTELVVGVVATKKLSGCPGCGRSCRRVHDRRQRQIRDLEISGRRTVLLWTQRRFVCDRCGRRHMGIHAQLVGCITRRLARRLVQDAQVMSIQTVHLPLPCELASHHGPGCVIHPGQCAGLRHAFSVRGLWPPVLPVLMPRVGYMLI